MPVTGVQTCALPIWRFIEELGVYNPLTNPAEIKVDAERVQQWVKNGAQPTETVRGLLKKAGVL